MAKLKGKISIGVSITVALAAIVIILVAVCGIVTINPMSDFDEPDYIEVHNLSATGQSGMTDSDRNLIVSAMQNQNKYSIMQAVLEWKWDYGYKFKKVTDPDDDDKLIKDEYTSAEVLAVSASETEYMIVYHYTPAKIVDGALDTSALKTITVEGENVQFDTVKILISNTDNNVGKITLIPYISARVGNLVTDNDELSSEFYFVTPITIRANTTAAIEIISNILA